MLKHPLRLCITISGIAVFLFLAMGSIWEDTTREQFISHEKQHKRYALEWAIDNSPWLSEKLQSVRDELDFANKQVQLLNELCTKYPEQSNRYSLQIMDWTSAVLSLEYAISDLFSKISKPYIEYLEATNEIGPTRLETVLREWAPVADSALAKTTKLKRKYRSTLK